jgi:hypothetical protein
MKTLLKLIKVALLVFILLLLVLPYLQSFFKIVKLQPLKGAIEFSENPSITLNGWFSGDYQTKQEKYLNESFGFRNFFIRINNQIAFDLFNEAKANGVIIGKDNYLYEENYIKAYYGTDYIGVDSIRNRMSKLAYIQDTLHKLNKTIILVFAAGKGSFYPEYFPARFKSAQTTRNFETYLAEAKKVNMEYIDFNTFFCENKIKSPYQLYPKYGIHWSYYGAGLAADSLLHRIEKLRNIDLAGLFWKDIELDYPKESDYDIADGMNLLFKLKSAKMAYPHYQFESNSGKAKPALLVVADSYYWGMYNIGISNAFSISHFWFYNKQIYPESNSSQLETNQINLKEEIEKHDIIVLLATESNLPNLGWGFIENTYDLFHKKSGYPN